MLLGSFLAMALQISSNPQIVRNKDAITDKETVLAVWLSDDGDTLAVACDPAKKDLRVALIVKGHYFGKTGLLTSSWPMTYRFDQDQPFTTDWYHDDDTAQVFGSKDIISFIQSILVAKKVVFRARENFGRGDQFDITFDLGETRSAVSDVVRACGDTKISRGLGSLINK